MKTLIVLSHPNFKNSRLNKALIDAAKSVSDVTVRHIEAVYGNDAGAIDAAAEANFVKNAERIVLQYPLYWLATPPMMKAYMDAAFSYCHQNGLLAGKELQIAVTTGSPINEYSKHGSNKFSLAEVLTPMQVTANYCGMTFNKIFAADGALAGITDEQIVEHAMRYVQMLKCELDEVNE